MCNCDNKCRLAITVEDSFSPCTFPKKYFDVVIRSKDGEAEVTGRVPAGGSEIFDLSCAGDGEYTVTVIGDVYSSPRSQTRRVRCCCGETSGVTFLFMRYEPECEQVWFRCPTPPCKPACIKESPTEPLCPVSLADVKITNGPCIEIPPKPPVCGCEDSGK